MDFIYNDLSSWKKKHYKIAILAGTKKSALHLVQQLNEAGHSSVLFEALESEIAETGVFNTGALERNLVEGQIAVFEGSLNKGFEYPEIRFAVVSDKEIFKQKIKKKESRTKSSKDTIKTFAELAVGDYVVHQNHGIGLYVGIDKLTVEGTIKDYIKHMFL
jgi:transcription-repair coupling factor (superfamily II helicase)